ncbi:hypothetical protein GGF31_005225 [Allomyces arbusculus]|nr:hypothetical protein GGF31_005225 [Allomyces arbusculus]
MAADSLNALQGAALIAGAMVGSGIFTNPSKVVELVGATGPALIMWIIGALVAFTASMAYAEWGSRLPVSGGDAPFLDFAYPVPRRLLAVMYAWTRVALINPGYCASLGMIAGTYLVTAFPDTFPEHDGDGGEWYAKRLGAGIVALLTLMCVPSNHLAGRFVTGVTMISVTLLLAFSASGILALVGIIPGRTLDNFSNEHLFAGTKSHPGAFAMAFFKIMWSYDGFANLASSLGELKNPERNIQRATFMGITTVAVLFLLANLSFFVVVPYADMSTAGSSVAAIWGQNLFGPSGRIVVSLLIFFVVCACCEITTYSASRIGQATGESRLIVFPKFFAALNGRFGTPVNALAFNFLMTMVQMFMFSGDAFWMVMDSVSYPLWLFYGLTNLGLFLVKLRSPQGLFGRDPTRKGVHVNALGPLAVFLVSLFLLIFPFFDSDTSRLTSGIGLAFVVSGVVPYFALVVWPERHAKAA